MTVSSYNTRHKKKLITNVIIKSGENIGIIKRAVVLRDPYNYSMGTLKNDGRQVEKIRRKWYYRPK